MKRLFLGLFLSVVFSVQAAVPGSTAKKRMLADLDFIKNVFEVNYAPLEWKRSYAGWDLDEEIELAKAKVESLPAPSTKAYRTILRDFFNSTRDYHVGVHFHSTEQADLPFLVRGAEGRYFIVHIERSALPYARCKMEVGDELVLFGGRPTGEVIEELRLKHFGTNTLQTDRALAELGLTVRSGELGDEIPSGPVDVVVKKKSSGKQETYHLKWEYTPEKIKDFSLLGAKAGVQMAYATGTPNTDSWLKESGFFKKMFITPLWDRKNLLRLDNPHVVGARKSYIPTLGRKIWDGGLEYPFHAYVFTNTAGRQIGYVRIPHYHGDEEEVHAFGDLIELMQKHTDALIVDQINNPGGSLFYLYGLASMLTSKPLATPKHHLSLTQREVETALTLLPILEKVRNSQEAVDLLGSTFEGYPVNYQTVRLMRNFCSFLIREWESGHLYTGPTYVFGVDTIDPHPRAHYTKPILLLINSLDFSAGDFLPAIMQDNKRALILGSRTAGAGGYVMGVHHPNQSGISGFHFTGSIAERIDQKPIENLGVHPDIVYEHTARDFQEGYPDYVQAIHAALDQLLR